MIIEELSYTQDKKYISIVNYRLGRCILFCQMSFFSFKIQVIDFHMDLCGKSCAPSMDPVTYSTLLTSLLTADMIGGLNPWV